MSASLPARIIRTTTGWYIKNIDASKAEPAKYRGLLNLFGKLMIPAFGVRAEPTTLAGLRAEWLTPKNPTPDKVMLFLHGGGYVMGDVDSHRQFASHIARAGSVRTVVPEYRLAPEHKFPAGLDDCVAAYQALLEQGSRPDDIVVAGDSAGGGLTVATLLKLRELGMPQPAAAILFSPLLDGTGSGESMESRREADPWFTPENLAVVFAHYCEPSQLDDPLVSPVFADLQGLPPLYIQVGDREILLSDSERIANRQRAAGGEAVLEIWPGMWHVFGFCTQKMPESREAIRRVGDYIKKLFAA